MYWVTAVALVVFGFLGGFSIGGPFLMLGLAMLAPTDERSELAPRPGHMASSRYR